MQKTKLDKEEQEILHSFERGEWKPVANRRQEIARHVAYARNTLAKDKRVNIRISSRDLEELQAIAVEDGMPYQTLMASVLHRFASGRFVETASRSGSRRNTGARNTGTVLDNRHMGLLTHGNGRPKGRS